ncbi:hypothetical protein BY996DRAFT_6414451 [Phakopsora pachyrhizi]|nr:hypothetical protein BY996DRAFT_6414451 [Phakopsora pachyrhizi]
MAVGDEVAGTAGCCLLCAAVGARVCDCITVLARARAQLGKPLVGKFLSGAIGRAWPGYTLRMDVKEKAQQQRTEQGSGSWFAGFEAFGTRMKPSTGQIKI